MANNEMDRKDMRDEEEGLLKTKNQVVEEEYVNLIKEFLPTYPNHEAKKAEPPVEFNNKPDSLFFNDGMRKIDFILVYEKEEETEAKVSCCCSQKPSKQKQRESFQENLMKIGLELETTPSVDDSSNGCWFSFLSDCNKMFCHDSQKGKLMFVKVHMPWKLIYTYAEYLHIKIPIKLPSKSMASESEANKSKASESKAAKSCCFPSWINKCLHTSVTKDSHDFTVFFDHVQDLDIENRNNFTPSMRSRMAFYILSRAPYEIADHNSQSDKKIEDGKIEFGIAKLLDSGVYKAAYPLHDCKFDVKSEEKGCLNERYELYTKWANLKAFYKMQPLHLIRKYFGEKVGFYFAWLGFYTFMLNVAAAVGLGVFLYGYHNRETSTWSKEVCNPEIGGQIVMCPQCDLCKFWRLNSTCNTSKTLFIFDNFGTLAFSIFMSAWVTVFLEFWKRYQAGLVYEWDTETFLEKEELVHPEKEGKSKKDPNENTMDTVCGRTTVICDPCDQLVRHSIGMGTVLFWILLILASIVAVIVYRLAIFVTFSYKFRNNKLKNLEPIKVIVTPQMATSVTASIINFVVIMILNVLYERVAIWITDFELPQTRTDYENSLTMKKFLFHFVNYYSSIFYIAFVKGKVVGHPGDPVYVFGKYRNEECDPGGCLFELTTQFSVIMGGKIVLNILKLLLQWLKIFRYCAPQVSENKPCWEQDYLLKSKFKLGLFYEYLEMVIQFGFVTLFVASFPLAPILALINNLLEIRVDALKITTQWQRIVPEKAQDIGAWQTVLRGFAILAVATNAMIIAFTSDIIPRFMYYWSFSVYPYGANSEYTMKGYINSSLSVFNISNIPSLNDTDRTGLDHITTCRYRDYRFPAGHSKQYEYNMFFWHVIAAKMAFVIIVEHFVYLIKFILSYVIPDVSYAVKEHNRKRKYKTAFFKYECRNKPKLSTSNTGEKVEKGEMEIDS